MTYIYKCVNIKTKNLPENIKCNTCDVNVLCNVCYEALFHIDWFKEDIEYNIFCQEAYAKKEFLKI